MCILSVVLTPHIQEFVLKDLCHALILRIDYIYAFFLSSRGTLFVLKTIGQYSELLWKSGLNSRRMSFYM